MRLHNIFRLLPIWVLAFLSCGGIKTPPQCSFKNIQKIFSVRGTLNRGTTGEMSSYSHLVLLRDFSRECMDSTTIINIAHRYIDTVKYEKPVDALFFYSSDNNFIKGETSQMWGEVDKECLVKIYFDAEAKSVNPIGFEFYNSLGQTVYEGTQWVDKGFNRQELNRNKEKGIILMSRKGSKSPFIDSMIDTTAEYIDYVRKKNNLPDILSFRIVE